MELPSPKVLTLGQIQFRQDKSCPAGHGRRPRWELEPVNFVKCLGIALTGPTWPTVTVNVGGLGCRLHHPQSIHGPVTKMLVSQQQLMGDDSTDSLSGISIRQAPKRPSQYCSPAQPPPHSQPHKRHKTKPAVVTHLPFCAYIYTYIYQNCQTNRLYQIQCCKWFLSIDHLRPLST